MTLIAAAVCSGVCACAARAQPPADAAPATIQRQVVWRSTGVSSLSLGNGVDIHLRSMPRPGAGKVVIAVFVPGIELEETAQTRGTAMLAVESLKLTQGGTGGGDAKLRATLRPEGLLITVACPTDKAEAVLRQVAMALADPTLDAALFDDAKTKAIAAAGRAADKPETQAAEALLSALTPAGDARLRRPTEQELRAVTLESAQEFIRRLCRVRAIDAAIVGDVTPGVLAGPAAEAFGALPARTRDRLAPLRTAVPPALDVRDLTVSGSRPLLTVALPAPGIEQLTEARLALLAATAMQHRLGEALRSSGLNVGSSTSDAVTGRTYPGMGMVVASFSLTGDAAKLGEAQGVVRLAIKKLIEDGPSKSELSKAVNASVKDIDQRLEAPEYWSQGMAMAWFLGLSIDELASAPGTLREATRTSVRQHMERWWGDNGQKAVTVLVQPPDAPKSPDHTANNP